MKDLHVFNDIENLMIEWILIKYQKKNDTIAIFDSIMTLVFNNSLNVHFRSIEINKHSIDNYLGNKYRLDIDYIETIESTKESEKHLKG